MDFVLHYTKVFCHRKRGNLSAKGITALGKRDSLAETVSGNVEGRILHLTQVYG